MPGLLLEKIPKSLDNPNSSRKNRAREGKKALDSKAKGEERREKRGKQKLVCGAPPEARTRDSGIKSSVLYH